MVSHKQIRLLWASQWARGLPTNHHRLGWVQYFFPSREFWALPLLGWFQRGLLGSLLLGGSGGYGHWDVRLGCLNQGSGHALQQSYTLKNFFIQKGEVATHLLPQLLYTFGQPMWLPSSRQIRLLHPILKGMGIVFGGGWKLLLRRHSEVGGPGSGTLLPSPHWPFGMAK